MKGVDIKRGTQKAKIIDKKHTDVLAEQRLVTNLGAKRKEINETVKLERLRKRREVYAQTKKKGLLTNVMNSMDDCQHNKKNEPQQASNVVHHNETYNVGVSLWETEKKITEDVKLERLRKRREAYAQKKKKNLVTNVINTMDDCQQNQKTKSDNTSPVLDDTQTYNVAMSFRRKRKQISETVKLERLRKRREAYAEKKKKALLINMMKNMDDWEHNEKHESDHCLTGVLHNERYIVHGPTICKIGCERTLASSMPAGCSQAIIKQHIEMSKGTKLVAHESYLRLKMKGIISSFSIYETGEPSQKTVHRGLTNTTYVLSEKTTLHGKTVGLPTRNRKAGQKGSAGIELLDSIVDSPDILVPPTCCQYCQAIKFHGESKYLCCLQGQIVLSEHELPKVLKELFLGDSAESSAFRRLVRTYNNIFAFTSLGVCYDKTLANKSSGTYIFKVQGQIYHFLNNLQPAEGRASFLQLYFHDTEHELENRMAVCEQVNADIIVKLMEVMDQNPYACFFRHLRSIETLESYQIALRMHPDSDQRVFNKPTVSQVAALWVENGESEPSSKRDIRVYTKEGRTHQIQYYYGCYDPLQYPLLHPFGETGWHEGIKKSQDFHMRLGTQKQQRQPKILDPKEVSTVEELLSQEDTNLNKGRNKADYVSMREYYAYKLQMRHDRSSIFLHSGRLLQQYVVDIYVKIETQRLDFYRTKQKDLRREQLQGIMDSVMHGQTEGSKVGQRIILPASFIGGPRDMRRRYVDAMTLVEKFGKPDLFITMTCNPCWPELEEHMLKTDVVENRPDLIARVFRAKLKELKNELFRKHIFGEIAAYTYVVEFQKRGLPHAHFLLLLKPNAKIYSVDAYDKIVSAELPDETKYPFLFQAVKKHMMHGPCGKLKPSNVCMKSDGSCRNHYPKDWAEHTTHQVNSYPLYRRRNNRVQVQVRGHLLDNRWVVPHNPYLLAKFNCHINVEICSTITAVKYIYKYIYKGHDRIHFQVNGDDTTAAIDEIKEFQTGRWVSPPEAMWRIFRFALNEMQPAVIHLQLHLENYQNMSFEEDVDLRSVLSNTFLKKTMLTEFFAINKCDESVQKEQHTYKEFPQHFVWLPGERRWKRRQQKHVIGRIVLANPIEGERYFLRLLLLHVRGPTSYDDLKTIDGKYVSTFREAAVLRGLFATNDAQEQCLQEASLFHMPYSLRRLFATILVYLPPNDPHALWIKFRELMQEDFRKLHFATDEQIDVETLQHINRILESMGKNINMYALVPNFVNFDRDNVESREALSERHLEVNIKDLQAAGKLNAVQRRAFEMIKEKVYNNQPGLFFIDGPGGTGKTFLYRVLLAEVRSKGYVALANATSGVAAALLPGGRTAHSRFKIPLDIHDKYVCNLSKQSSAARLIADAKLIIWDEAPMAHRLCIEAVDRLLQDLMESSCHFGGKVMVFGGDFRQILPVIPKGSKQDCLRATLVYSNVWPALTKIQLTENMRAQSDPDFAAYLLNLGNGAEPTNERDEVKIPRPLLLPYVSEEESLSRLIDIVYGNFEDWCLFRNECEINKAILTTKNEYVDDINTMLIDKFPGNAMEYFSRDEATNDTAQTMYEDFLNTLIPNGFPAHRLRLKYNCPVMLLRNIDPAEGLCNGSRLICRGLRDHVIDAVIAAGEHIGKQVFIHRIKFAVSSDEICPIPFQRTQFPLRLCFAMTINKAQGQTLDFVGIYLREPVFSHGQLYVALSRAKSSKDIKILMRPAFADDNTDGYTKNIVYSEVLSIPNSS